MTWPDVVNGLFEGLGLFFVVPSIVRLHREKMVRGVSLWQASFFPMWGCWNLFYYPHLGQWWSAVGAVGLLVANAVWWAQMVFYGSHRGHRGHGGPAGRYGAPAAQEGRANEAES